MRAQRSKAAISKNRILKTEIQITDFRKKIWKDRKRDGAAKAAPSDFSWPALVRKGEREDVLAARLCFVVAAENVHDLVFDDLFDGRAGVAEVLSGIEVIGVFEEMFTDRRGASDAEVGVDVDLADGHGSRFAEHFFGDADSVGHFAAVLVDDGDAVLRNGRSAVQDDRETGQAFADFFEDIEAQLRFLAGFEFISAVAGADGDGEGIAAGFLGEFADLVGLGEVGVFGLDVDGVFDACELAEFCFHDDAALMRVLDDFFRDFDIFFESVVRRVDHDGRKPVVDGRFASFEVSAVVEVHDDGKSGRFDGCLNQVFQVDGVGIFSCACGDLKDERGIAFFTRFDDSLDGFHVVDVERADRIAAFIRFFEHFGRSNQRHNIDPP